MRYILKMLACFAVSMYLIVQASHLAADGQPVLAGLLGVFVFAIYVYMAAASAKAEREATKAARRESHTLSISPGKAIIDGKFYDIPAQTWIPDELEAQK